MKKMKKLVSFLLAMVMVFSMTTTLFATEAKAAGEYSITINGNATGHTYEAYQVFAGKLSGNVLSDVTWGDGVNGAAIISAISSDTLLKNSLTLPESNVQASDVAKALSEMNADTTKTTDVKAAITKAFAKVVGNALVAEKKKTSTASDKTYTISGLDAGYYFVKDQDSSLGQSQDAYTEFMLKVVKSVTVTPKSDVPTVEKKVKENSKTFTGNTDERIGDYTLDAGYNDVADWNIGDNVPFQLIGTLPSNLSSYTTYKYVFHDTLGKGLTYNADAKVYVVSKGENGALSKVEVKSGYTISPTSKPTTLPEADTTITVTIDNMFNLKDASDQKINVTGDNYILVEYTAELNTNAQIGLPGNVNKVNLTFSNNPNGTGEGKTPDDHVIVFTYELDTTKVDGASWNEETQTYDTKLAGAEFVLYKVVEGENWYAIVDVNHKVTGWQKATVADDVVTYPEGSTLTSAVDTGLFTVIGLDDGTYFLKETKAPAQYNLLTKDIELVVGAKTANGQTWTNEDPASALTKLELTVNDGAATEQDTTNHGVAATDVENNKGATLPETGGIGTTIFYVLGAILVIGAGILLVTKKRMSAEK